jgi:hypothetical protein
MFSRFRPWTGRPRDDETFPDEHSFDSSLDPLGARGPASPQSSGQWTWLGALLRPLLNPEEARDVLRRTNLRGGDGESRARASLSGAKPDFQLGRSGQPDVEHSHDLEAKLQSLDGTQVAAAGDLRCQGMRGGGGCSRGGSYGTTATHDIERRLLCHNCAYKTIGGPMMSPRQAIETLVPYELKAK